MAFDGFDETDYELMRKPGQKVLLTLLNGLSNVATVISFDENTKMVSLQNDRNEFMNQALLDRLSPGVFAVDLREYPHQWIDEDSFYCFACHTLELDHLFVCNHGSHSPHKVAFHDRCLDVNLGHIIPNNNSTRTWICPMHSNVLRKMDPSSLHTRRRNGDYDFDFDRPLKKRKFNIADPDWLQLPDDREAVYPRHIECGYCVAEGMGAECDGNRPCNVCCRYVRAEVLDLTLPKFISMDEHEVQSEVDAVAIRYCKNRQCSFAEFEHDVAVRKWLEIHDNALYHRLVQEKRERDHLKEEEAALSVLDAMDEDEDLTSNQHRASAADGERDELVALEVAGYTQPEFVCSVPIYARYQCPKCHALFGDKYRWTMHRQWAHQKVVVSKSALRREGILNHFHCAKPLKYECPYSGCLRGANSSDEIEDHILRHHDITDPTKPKKKETAKKGAKQKNATARKVDVNADDVKVVGVAFLTQSEKRKISKVWHEAKATRIDKENGLNLIKNFVSAIVDDRLDRFDETTKRLQRNYKTEMERIAANNQRDARLAQSSHVPRHDLLPIPPQQLLVPEEVMETETRTGPKSMWQ